MLSFESNVNDSHTKEWTTRMKRLSVFLMLLAVLSLSCSLTGAPLSTPTGRGDGGEALPSPTGRGDGRETLPSPTGRGDGGEGTTQPQVPTEAAAEPTVSDEKAILYLGIMVHLEGWNDDQDQERFAQHVQLMREYASLFETYGAKLTWESKEVTDGALKWGDNVLLEMQQRGHGVGVHADIGGNKNYNCRNFAAGLRAEKEQLESLGVTVRHVSGIVSHCDWVTAAADAGYLFTTGNVAYAVMSMPAENRPPEYRDCQTPASCHDVFPAELEARLHPWRANSGADWLTHDPNGKLVILPSSGGLCVRPKSDDPSCEAFFRELEQAIALAQPGQVNTYYVSWSLGQSIELDVLEAWLQRIDAYVKAGQVEWKTLPEMYDAYVRNEH